MQFRFNLLEISAGESEGSFSSSNATAPETRGAAIDVPLKVLRHEQVKQKSFAATTKAPGAKISTQDPALVLK